MAQVLKEEVERRLQRAALEVFAHKGYRSATMADIAERAGSSVGNLYRYYRSKDELFYDVVPGSFVTQLVDLVHRRMAAAPLARDPLTLPPAHQYQVLSAELIEFCIAHRERVVVVLGRAEGSRYERTRSELVTHMCSMAKAYFQRAKPEAKLSKVQRLVLEHIYDNLVRVMIDLLVRCEQERELRAAISDYSRYHLGGLVRLFE